MVFVNPWDASEKFIPVLINCFLDLKSLACAMANDSMRKTSLNEFLYKLKCLEKELYMVSNKLKETFRKNESLNKELDTEKEKSRKKTAKIKELESQLASAEFKLKVRTSQKYESLPNKIKKTKDANVQSDYQVDNTSDMFNTVRNLRRTAQSTLVSIRNLIIGQGDAQTPELPLPLPRQSEENLSSKHSNASNIYELYDCIKIKTLSSRKSMHHTEQTSETVMAEFSNTSIFTTSANSEENIDDEVEALEFEEDSDSPYKLLKSMQNKVRKLKMKNVEMFEMSEEPDSRMAAALDEQKHTTKMLQQQLNLFLSTNL